MSTEKPGDNKDGGEAKPAPAKAMTRRQALKHLAATAAVGAGVTGLVGCTTTGSGGNYGGGYSGGYSSSSYSPSYSSSYSYTSSYNVPKYSSYYSHSYGYSSYGYYSTYR